MSYVFRTLIAPDALVLQVRSCFMTHNYSAILSITLDNPASFESWFIQDKPRNYHES